jgi:hypothetical protein
VYKPFGKTVQNFRGSQFLRTLANLNTNMACKFVLYLRDAKIKLKFDSNKRLSTKIASNYYRVTCNFKLFATEYTILIILRQN